MKKNFKLIIDKLNQKVIVEPKKGTIIKINSIYLNNGHKVIKRDKILNIEVENEYYQILSPWNGRIIVLIYLDQEINDHYELFKIYPDYLETLTFNQKMII